MVNLGPQIVGMNAVHLAITAIGAILCYLPLMTGADSHMENSSLGMTLRGELYNDKARGASYASLALMIPLAFDLSADTILFMTRFTKGCDKRTQSHWKSGAEDGPSFNSKEKLLFLISIVLLAGTILSPSTTRNIALRFSCAQKAQMVLLYGVVTASLSRHSQKYFPSILVLSSIAVMVVGNVVSAFVANVQGPASGPLSTFRLVTRAGTLLLLVSQCFIWLFFKLRRWWKNLIERRNNEKSALDRLHDVDANVVYEIIHVLIYIIYTAMLLNCQFRYNTIAFIDDEGICEYLLPYIFYEFALSVFNMRMVKHNVVEGLVALLNAKKQYVRYISHEIRTPLNAAFLGLSLLADDLKQSSRPEDIERCETLHDVQFSCTTALDILNDLLTFEKLESGILELHQQEVELKGFLLDCVNMFSAQAKATHVRLEFRNLNELKTSTAASTSTASDARYGTPQLAPAMDSELTIEGGAMGCVPPPSSSSSSPASASVSYRSRTGGALPIENTDVISVDRFKMAQVIRNLLSNALKFTSAEGSVTVTACFIPNDTIFTFRSERTNTQAALVIPTGNHRDAATSDVEHGLLSTPQSPPDPEPTIKTGKLRISVTDTGAGISPENQKRLFKEVVQFNPEVLQAGGGSGFGLYISRKIVDLHEGTLSVYSEGEGKGSTFSLEIPMTRKVVLQCTSSSRHSSHNTEHSHTDVFGFVTSSTATTVSPIERLEKGDSNCTIELFKVGSIDFRSDSGGCTTAGATPVPVPVPVSVSASSQAQVQAEASEENETTSGVRASPRSYGDIPVYRAHLHLSERTPRSSKTDTSKKSGNTGNTAVEDRQDPPTKYDLLVVDDSTLSRKMLIKLLTSKGNICEEAEDGLMALERVKARYAAGRREYDAILMDFVMPNMDGPTATKELRKMNYKGVIFGVTGNGLQSDIDHFVNMGANKVLVKPFNITDFKSALEEYRVVASDTTGADGATGSGRDSGGCTGGIIDVCPKQVVTKSLSV